MLWVAGLALLRPDVATASSSQRFEGIYEPSAVVQLADGRVLVAEDEGDQPLHLFSIVSATSGLSLKTFGPTTSNLKADDLEAAELGGKGEVVLMTSHSVTKNGERKKKREKLIRLHLKDQQGVKLGVIDDLAPALKKHLSQTLSMSGKVLDELNIEGIAYRPEPKALLIGFRSPLDGGKAIVITLLDYDKMIDDGASPEFSKGVILLDLDGAGIRGFAYDQKNDRYFIAGEAPNKKGKLRSRVWSWSGVADDKPVRLKLPKIKGMKNVEGLAIVTHEGSDYLLFVCDNGKKDKKKGAAYGFIPINDISSP